MSPLACRDCASQRRRLLRSRGWRARRAAKRITSPLPGATLSGVAGFAFGRAKTGRGGPPRAGTTPAADAGPREAGGGGKKKKNTPPCPEPPPHPPLEPPAP